jgi:hypothetical protein
VFINLHIENDFIQKITQVKYINSLCSFEHHELEHKLCICVLPVSTLPMIYKFVITFFKCSDGGLLEWRVRLSDTFWRDYTRTIPWKLGLVWIKGYYPDEDLNVIFIKIFQMCIIGRKKISHTKMICILLYSIHSLTYSNATAVDIRTHFDLKYRSENNYRNFCFATAVDLNAF